VAKRLYRRHGVTHFYRGLSTCLVRAFCVNAVMFPMYEACAGVLRRAAGGRGETDVC
jgi:hypothetical protein